MRIWRRKQFEDDMDAGLRFHIESCVADLVRSGLDPAEAERRARIEFGSVEARKDECRQAWGLQRLDELRADLRLTFRTTRQNPGFAGDRHSFAAINNVSTMEKQIEQALLRERLVAAFSTTFGTVALAGARASHEGVALRCGAF